MLPAVIGINKKLQIRLTFLSVVGRKALSNAGYVCSTRSCSSIYYTCSHCISVIFTHVS